jgi:hypothetical protein
MSRSFKIVSLVNRLPEGYALVSVDIGADVLLNAPGDQLFWYINEYCFGIPKTVQLLVTLLQLHLSTLET